MWLGRVNIIGSEKLDWIGKSVFSVWKQTSFESALNRDVWRGIIHDNMDEHNGRRHSCQVDIR